MEYYGDLNYKRLMEVSTYSTKDIMNDGTKIGFIYSKGMLLDYALTWFEKGVVQYSRNYFNDCDQASRIAHPSEIPEERRHVIWTDAWKNMKKVKRNKVVYYIGEYGVRDSFGVFIELPRISNDRELTWKPNKKYDTLECVLDKGSFEYEIIVKASGNARIIVRYTKCENKHRNNVALAEINVTNASNEDIKEAIRIWKENTKRELSV